MSDADLIASPDSPFPPWVRDTVRDLRDELAALRGPDLRERVLAGVCAARVQVGGTLGILYADDDGTLPIFAPDEPEANLIADAVVRALTGATS